MVYNKISLFFYKRVFAMKTQSEKELLEIAISHKNASGCSNRSAVSYAMRGITDNARRLFLFPRLLKKIEKRGHLRVIRPKTSDRVLNQGAKAHELYHAKRTVD